MGLDLPCWVLTVSQVRLQRHDVKQEESLERVRRLWERRVAA